MRSPSLCKNLRSKKMDKRSKAKVDQFITSGTAPKRLKGSEAIALQTGKSIVKLVDDEGEPTLPGRYWSQRTGEDLPAGGFMQQAASRIGNVETIRLRDGTRGVVRRWNEATEEYNFTRLGYTYYKTVRRNYVAQVPVIIKGKRKDGSYYTVKSTMPVSKLGIRPKTLPTNNNDVTRRDAVRRMVGAPRRALRAERRGLDTGPGRQLGDSRRDCSLE